MYIATGSASWLAPVNPPTQQRNTCQQRDSTGLAEHVRLIYVRHKVGLLMLMHSALSNQHVALAVPGV